MSTPEKYDWIRVLCNSMSDGSSEQSVLLQQANSLAEKAANEDDDAIEKMYILAPYIVEPYSSIYDGKDNYEEIAKYDDAFGDMQEKNGIACYISQVADMVENSELWMAVAKYIDENGY